MDSRSSLHKFKPKRAVRPLKIRFRNCMRKMRCATGVGDKGRSEQSLCRAESPVDGREFVIVVTRSLIWKKSLSSSSTPLFKACDPVGPIFLKMSTVNSKILRTANAPTTAPDEIERNVAQALIDLENNVPELKSDLRALQISAAREVDVRGGKKAIVVFVPVPQLKAFHKVQQRLTRELEKKFSDRHVVFIAQRRMLRKPTRNSRVKQKRPRSRTLTNVHEKILEDLVYPTEIVGKRTRVAVDGSKLLKVLLDSKDATSLEYKLDSFSSVYRRLTGKDVVFEFPVVAQE